MTNYISKVYKERPAYASFDSENKFAAIQGIVAGHLKAHPNAICSYSGGADSDVLIDILERTRHLFGLQPIKYVFINTGIEMKATKDHVKETANIYGVEIEEIRPKINIVHAVRKCGIPFMSKVVSEKLNYWQRKNIPLAVVQEYQEANDKIGKFRELNERYPKSVATLKYLCSCNSQGEPYERSTQLAISSVQYLLEFLQENPPDFLISDRCCDYCKKNPAHEAQKGYDMVITGERACEGGARAVSREKGNTHLCFVETSKGQFRLRPLYYVTDTDKEWYKKKYNIKYSDAYEVYGLTRTGCCGCPINYRVVEDLENIRPYEPNVVKAAYNIFGQSYEYRAKFNEYRHQRRKV